MESRFGDAVLWARLFYVNALVYFAKDTDDLFFGVSFFFMILVGFYKFNGFG